MKRPAVFCLGILIALMATFAARAADDMDPDVKAALDEAKKAAAEGTNPQAIDVNKMLENAKNQAEKDSDSDPTPTPTPAPATKPLPLKALPDWIPPVPGFKSAAGATHWTEAGMEKGRMTGGIPGAPRDVMESYRKMVRDANKLNISVTDSTINGALTITINVSSREGDESNLELTLTPSPDGRNSLATFEYSKALPVAKPPVQ